MSRRPAEVVDGMRGPNVDLEPPKPEPQRRRLDLPEGTVEYICPEFPGLRLSLAHYDPVMLADGTLYKGRAVIAQFVRGRLVTDDVQVIHRLEGCPRGCQDHPHGEKPHKDYGLTKVFFRADEAEKAAEEKAALSFREQVKTMAKSNRGLLDDVLKEVNAESFDIPGLEGKKR
jgi:hypothetical protein